MLLHSQPLELRSRFNLSKAKLQSYCSQLYLWCFVALVACRIESIMLRRCKKSKTDVQYWLCFHSKLHVYWQKMAYISPQCHGLPLKHQTSFCCKQRKMFYILIKSLYLHGTNNICGTMLTLFLSCMVTMEMWQSRISRYSGKLVGYFCCYLITFTTFIGLECGSPSSYSLV